MDEIDELAELIVQKSGLSVQVELKRLVKEITSMIRALVASREAAAAEAMRGQIVRRFREFRAALLLNPLADMSGMPTLEWAERTALTLPNAAPEPQALRVPEGWRLVPVNLTVKMQSEAARLHNRFLAEGLLPNFAELYRTFIAAAPAPPSDGGKE